MLIFLCILSSMLTLLAYKYMQMSQLYIRNLKHLMKRVQLVSELGLTFTNRATMDELSLVVFQTRAVRGHDSLAYNQALQTAAGVHQAMIDAHIPCRWCVDNIRDEGMDVTQWTLLTDVLNLDRAIDIAANYTRGKADSQAVLAAANPLSREQNPTDEYFSVDDMEECGGCAEEDHDHD